MRIDQDLPKMDQWVCLSHGQYVLDVERQVLDGVLPQFFGYHIVQLGGPTQSQYMDASLIRHKVRFSLDGDHSFPGDNVQVERYDLPLKPESVDVMLLPHVLEYSAEPERILHQCYQHMVADGTIIILGFNPFSLWGMAKLLKRQDRVYRRAQFIAPYKVRRSLHHAGFDVVSFNSMCFRLPVASKRVFESTQFLEPLGRFILPSAGGIYMIIAKKKVVPMNLIVAPKLFQPVRVRPVVAESSI
ncbi:MAG: methyltransferase domain-containing protein [Coxiellaceae bacterium]|nr:methyltransferase domain-containing protein [Coxiellaceae bacterium]